LKCLSHNEPIAKLKVETDQMVLLVGCVGSEDETVNGIVLSLRPEKDKFDVWVLLFDC